VGSHKAAPLKFHFIISYISNNQISPILISEKRGIFVKTVSPLGDFSTPKIKMKISTENATLKKKKEAQQISQENSSHSRAFIIFQVQYRGPK
jgi:hypothetical protein